MTEENLMDVTLVLESSKKVRISRDALNELVRSAEGVRQLIFLLSDRDQFIRQIQDEFPSWTVLETDLSPVKPQYLPFQSVMICKNEVPGPLAFGNISWNSVGKMLSWPSVIQVEKTQFYSGTKES